jgi:tRNA A-37 threonylcarbamoyl transferase component Bud32
VPANANQQLALQQELRMQLVDGQPFAGYRIIRSLGHGGMASVFLALEDEGGVDRHVALKVLPEHLLANEMFYERFQQEASVIAKLEHPNIVPLYRFGVEQVRGIEVPWMALRYIDGGDLRSKLAAGASDSAAMLVILRKIAAALDYAHQRGIVHRDLKPHNVLTTSDHQVYLADFGIAKILEGTRIASPTGDMALGTPEYMAPEQATGETITPATDVYALGIMVFEWLTGSTPYSANTPHALLVKHINESLPIERLRRFPPGVANAVAKATSKTPSERFASADAFIDALEQGFQAATKPARMSTVRQGVFAAGLLLAAAAGTIFWPARRDEPDVANQGSVGAAPSPQKSPEATRSSTLQDEAIIAPRAQVLAPAEQYVADLMAAADLPPADLSVQVLLDPDKDTFVARDEVRIGFMMRDDAYPVVLAYSLDGEATLLYPNSFESTSMKERDRIHWVGRQEQAFRIVVKPPYGVDVIQVAAFRRQEDVKLLLDVLDLQEAGPMFRSVGRDSLKQSLGTMQSRGFGIEMAPAADGTLERGGWGEARRSVRTAASSTD